MNHVRRRAHCSSSNSGTLGEATHGRATVSQEPPGANKELGSGRGRTPDIPRRRRHHHSGGGSKQILSLPRPPTPAFFEGSVREANKGGPASLPTGPPFCSLYGPLPYPPSSTFPPCPCLPRPMLKSPLATPRRHRLPLPCRSGADRHAAALTPEMLRASYIDFFSCLASEYHTWV